MRRFLITGGNRGIGLQVAKNLYAAGHDVTIACRDVNKGRAAAKSFEIAGRPVTVSQLDLCSFAAVHAFAKNVSESCDTVVHNAGVLIPAPQRRVTADGNEECMQVHAFAPLLLVKRLPFVQRHVFVTSELHQPGTRGTEVDFDFEDPNLEKSYDASKAYKNSKLAQIWLTFEIERRQLAHADCISPGFVPTTAAENTTGFATFFLRQVLSRMPFATPLDRAARAVADLAARDPFAKAGRYFDRETEKAPSEDARDPHKAERFFALAERIQTRGWFGN